jgi:hypothetical protein
MIMKLIYFYYKIMLSNRVVNSTFKALLNQQIYLMSVKKKQLELTLRTPYRNLFYI